MGTPSGRVGQVRISAREGGVQLRRRFEFASLPSRKGRCEMSSIGFVGPVKDVEAFKSFAKETNGARKAEHHESCKRLGLTKQRVFLAQTPMGAMVNAYSEGLNAGFFFARLRASSHAFDKFYLMSLNNMTGVNITDMPAGPPPNLAFEWANGKAGKSSTMMACPCPTRPNSRNFAATRPRASRRPTRPA